MKEIKIEDLKRGKLVEVTLGYSDHIQDIARKNNIDVPTVNQYMKEHQTINEDDLVDPVYIAGEIGSTIVSNFVGGLINNFTKGVLR